MSLDGEMYFRYNVVESEVNTLRRGQIREYTIFSEDGEVLSSTISRRAPVTRGRWFIVHTKAFIDYLQKSNSFLEVKVLFLLASKVTMETAYVKISMRAMAFALDCTERTVSKAVKHLEEQRLIARTKVDGVTSYLVNPGLMSKGGFALEEHRREWEKFWDVKEPKEIAVDKETGEIIRSDENAVQSSNNVANR